MKIKLDISNQNDLTDEEYDVVNNAFIRKSKEMDIFENYAEENIIWTIECKIGD